MTRIAPCVIAVAALGLSACTNPYDPVQRGFAGGLWGAASGAAIGAAAGGGPGAALERRWEGRPEYSGASRAHLHHHRAIITATQPTVTDIRHTDIQAMRTEPTRRPAMDIRNTPVLLHMLIPGAMDTRADLVSRITPLPPATDTPATRNIPLTSVRRGTDTKPMKAILRTQVRRAMDHRAI
jgi:hypothetical protein